ncbi:hypothetical protein [Candidatus Mycoplasma haematohominis]|uniref:hypothetical protein n=1 Tax=Candidatus Mycoplasma haematohominis TaxID=1494318 RepID=UPI001C0A690E|nr:hypothetical protein [Candidatus Mycoplasma haemohominis]
MNPFLTKVQTLESTQIKSYSFKSIGDLTSNFSWLCSSPKSEPISATVGIWCWSGATSTELISLKGGFGF